MNFVTIVGGHFPRPSWSLADGANRKVAVLGWSSDVDDSVVRGADLFRSTEVPAGPSPSLSTAVRDQWGLRLVPGEGTLKVVVIESAQLPTEN